jgi:hypothetical protein
MGNGRQMDDCPHLTGNREAARERARQLRGLIALGGVLLLFLIIAHWNASAVAAATISVTSSSDTTTTGDGVSLREAILSINAGSDLNTDVAAARSGSYTLDNNTIVISVSGPIVLSAANGTLTLAVNVVIGEVVADARVDGGCAVNVSGQCISGGVRVFTVNSGVTAALEGLTIQHGNAGTGSGGALANSGTLFLMDCTVLANAGSASGGTGGAIFNALGGTLMLENTTFSANSANTGGAVYSVGSVAVTNSTFSANVATNSGGGIVRASGAFTVLNTLVAGNTAPSDPDVSGTFGSGGHNLIGIVDGGTGFTGTGDLKGTAASLLNPLLGPLGAYGVLSGTQTFPLLPGSPAIDAGTATGAPASDERGFAQFGAAPDIGAFESRGFTDTVIDGGNQAALQNHAFGGALTVVVTANNQVEPVQGGHVTFTINPVGGASATLSGNPAPIGAGGFASATATANGTAGAYTVTGSAAGMPNATFTLTNGTVACVVTSVLDPEQAGKRTLRDAVDSANGGGCRSNAITFDPTAFPSGTPTTVTPSVPALKATMTIDGTGHQVVVDGSNVGTVFIVNSGVSAAISGLTIQNGTGGLGGGITNLGTLTVTNSTLRNNTAFNGGGGIFSNGTLNVTDCAFVNNVVGSNNDAGGGGIFNNGGTLNVTNSTFAGNVTSGSSGHAGGGAILNDGTLSVTNSTFTGNSATGTFVGGGGIFNGGTATITGSTFSGNIITGTNVGGGAIKINGTATIANSTFSGNQATGGVGGAIFEFSVSTLTMKNNTVVGNSADNSGGGIRAGGSLNVTNMIVAGNAAPSGPDVSGTVTSGGHNLISKTDGSTGFTAAGDQTGTIAAPLNPLLGPLASNGGPTQTFALLTSSPAINVGDPVACAATPVSGKDQRGLARRADRCSIGAYEAIPAIPNPLPNPLSTGGTPGSPNPLPNPRGAVAAQPGPPAPLPNPRP